MSNNKSNVWIGDKDLTRDESFIAISEQEFADSSLLETLGNEKVAESAQGNRRDFLKFLGFGLGAATVAAGCDIPVKRALPYVVKPEEIIPGVANYYASSFVNGSDFGSILVKTREARPIKIEGNAQANGTTGTSARAQASVLDLYDTNRFKNPLIKNGEEWDAITWEEIDSKIKSTLSSASNVRVLAGTVMSPSALAAVGKFQEKYPSTKIVSHDAVSYSGILDANEADFGDRVIPGYKFDKADVIVSFAADFLGTWVSPTEFNHDYAKGRAVDVKNPKMSKHIQVESGMSLTGSNADNRILVKPSAMGEAVAYLYGKIVGGSASSAGLTDKAKANLDKAASLLKGANGKSLVISGSNNPAEQQLVNAINNALGNYGNTIDFGSAYLNRGGNENEVARLISEMNSGSVDAIIIHGANPAYNHRSKEAFVNALAKVKTKISLGYSLDETSALCDMIAPAHHTLESWGDIQPKRNMISLIQPTIHPLFKTRQPEHSMLVWAGAQMDAADDQPYNTFMQENWRNTVFAQQSKYSSFKSFWEASLHDGMISLDATSTPTYAGNANSALSKINKSSNSELEISFFEPVTIGNGQYSNNPWLQEMPDPVTRTSWGNYLAIPVDKDMNGYMGLDDGDLTEISIGDKTLTVPVIKQFGQMPGTVSLALGYGRTVSGPAGEGIGVDVNDCAKDNGGYTQYYNDSVSVSGSKGKEEHFSCVQYHHTYGVSTMRDGEEVNVDEEKLGMAYGLDGYQGALTDRSVIYHSTVEDLPKNLEMLNKKRAHAQHLNSQQYYSGYDTNYEMGHHWGMHVDLNACTGCGACTVACMAENNVPVVGKKEVSRHHEMTWLRIDRYYYGDIENPRAVYQPLMCQHCDNAPCENVCPVNATNHSSEGLNQMTYNRCVGTRYCANNCPYKVRRFNWYDYTTADLFPGNQVSVTDNEEVPYGADNLTRMVLNPDVTVRTRGVIEKCSFCVQRIQEGKLTAKKESRRLRDGDVTSACMTACPTGAITFGDRNDKNGTLAKKLENPLNYIALEEINVRSSVNYTMKVDNSDESMDS